MKRAVEDVPKHNKPLPIKESLLNPFLVVEPDGLLDADDVKGVFVGADPDTFAEGRTELVPDPRIDGVEGERHANLKPPLQHRS